jgi:oligosaccharide repeat unit polymerase
LETFTNLVALACVAHFFWSYYWNCYRKGYNMDVWHFSLLFNLFIVHVMLPFSRSDLNALALGAWLLRRTQDHVTESYLISAFGYICIVLGGALWRVHLGFGMRRFFSRIIELPARGSLLLLRSRVVLICHGVIAVAIMAAVLLYYFKSAGFGFNLRKFLLVNTALRPVAQFSAFYSVLIGSYCLARFYEYRERSMMVIVSLITLGMLFYGERGGLFAIATMTILVFFLKRGRRLNLFRLGIGICCAAVLAALLDALREGGLSLHSMAAGFLISTFYGNSFSDTRDFALVLSFWDGHYLLGKTYLAGLMAFVPRFLSTFRDTWSYGVVTATMAGFSPKEHPGLRIGIVGEAYLNFGLVGVCLLGVFIGASTRLIDLRMKQCVALQSRADMRAYSYMVIGTVVGAFQNTSNASTLYSILLVLLISWVMLRVLVFLKLPA